MNLKISLFLFATLVGVWVSYPTYNLIISTAVGAGFGGIVYFITWVLGHELKKLSTSSLVGMAFGIGIASLMFFALKALIPTLLESLEIPQGSAFSKLVILTGFFCLFYLAISNGIIRGKELEGSSKKDKNKFAGTTKILDTSVIIDGRIADVAEAGFIEGVILIPKFIIKELQYIADSSDPIKRVRGRRGLDVLKYMQENIPGIVLKITDQDFPKVKEADLKLVELAKLINGTIITNDHNLNKVADLEDVKVLNLNKLSNAIKPVVLPGETMNIKVVKEGKEEKQGVGYLEDGTMVVVDDARIHLGKDISVSVTSVLQTPTGRMIFSRVKGKEGKQNHY